MSRGVNRPVFDCCVCGILAKIVVVFPVLRRSDGSGHEATAAVWTDIAQYLIHAAGTEGTFIGADACVKRLGRQCCMTVLAGWPELKHGGSLYRLAPR